jgi:hypothetical protein
MQPAAPPESRVAGAKNRALTADATNGNDGYQHAAAVKRHSRYERGALNNARAPADLSRLAREMCRRATEKAT